MYIRQGIWPSQAGGILPFSFTKLLIGIVLWIMIWTLMPEQYQDLILYMIGVK